MTFFPYQTISEFFEAEGGFEEDFDILRTEQESEEYEIWAAAHSDEIEEQAYQDWAAIAREDGEPFDRDAYEDYIQSLIPDD